MKFNNIFYNESRHKQHLKNQFRSALDLIRQVVILLKYLRSWSNRKKPAFCYYWERYCKVSKLEFTLFIPIITFKKFFFKLWSSIMTYDNYNITIIWYFTNYQFSQRDCDDQYKYGNNTYNYYNNNNGYNP